MRNAVTLVAGPYPHDLGPHTYVHGVDRGVLVTAEDAAALVSAAGSRSAIDEADATRCVAGVDQEIRRE